MPKFDASINDAALKRIAGQMGRVSRTVRGQEDLTIYVDDDSVESEEFVEYINSQGYDGQLHKGSGSSFLMDEDAKQLKNELWDRYCKTASRQAQEDTDSQQSYYANIRNIADELHDEWREGQLDDVQQRVHEEVDGSYWIIYYHANMKVLEYSSNDDAIDDMGAELDTSQGWRGVIQQVAYYAMEADLNEALDELGFDGEGFPRDDEDDEDEEY
jgi:hypothetical protein